jgi:hypothetical protein
MRRLLLLLLLLGISASTSHAEGPAPTPTVDLLIAKNLEAKGGAEALAAFISLRIHGRVLVNRGQL